MQSISKHHIWTPSIFPRVSYSLRLARAMTMSGPSRSSRPPRAELTPNQLNQVRISKTLSSTLRHNAKAEGLTISDDGYVNVGKLVN